MATNYDYDVLYLGAGHGTFDGAIPLAGTGKKVAVVEAEAIGGTCPNWGCNAKIALDAPVALTREQERIKDQLNGEQLTINWTANMARKHSIIDVLPGAIEGLMTSAGIDVIKGYGKLTDPHTVEVDGEKKTADKIVIATGLTPHKLNIPGTELAHNSKDFLALSHLPKRITIVGGGYIAMEFATIANAAGADVTVMLHSDVALRPFYQPFVKKVLVDLQRRGVHFVKNSNVRGFKKDGDALAVEYGENDTLATDWILDATGRIPNVHGLGLEEVGVKFDERHGIDVNDHLQTSVENIYASGDVINSKQPKLTPTAIFESTYLTGLLSGQSDAPIDFPAVGTNAFTSPRISEAGVSVADAENDDNYKVVKTDLKDDWYYQVDNDAIAERALVFDKEGHLVGASEVSSHAVESINTLLPAIEFKLSKEQIGRIIQIFPSVASDVWATI
ncbi:NAD(P)/FAD-dependent oxidoreductase [Lactobacillus sp. Sy-1]|uniref:dihydrolipoyl dehydrogenase family protein n=1 Tax=Lactobacillus sp. Sy-1 TaxID=2109645 RepID=UPI001C56125B|nr:NAD(P)/FAD-dependent oxidoreductase [Lactobacillus sp. Sy-1]MBW1605112.1 NAD(P)/FAD-dependent oxidoreductase [Lactobacillus sp. Sy-1]